MDPNYDITNVLFYVNTFLIVPVASTFFMYAFSASKTPKEIATDLSPGSDLQIKYDNNSIISTEQGTEVIVKVGKGSGKQMRFRNA